MGSSALLTFSPSYDRPAVSPPPSIYKRVDKMHNMYMYKNFYLYTGRWIIKLIINKLLKNFNLKNCLSSIILLCYYTFNIKFVFFFFFFYFRYCWWNKINFLETPSSHLEKGWVHTRKNEKYTNAFL